eukprot:m.152639 g.152639  ORF g.152639 m.152639 type:complete len:207 (+) comp38598_c0_seq2:231-851(+)
MAESSIKTSVGNSTDERQTAEPEAFSYQSSSTQSFTGHPPSLPHESIETAAEDEAFPIRPPPYTELEAFSYESQFFTGHSPALLLERLETAAEAEVFPIRPPYTEPEASNIANASVRNLPPSSHTILSIFATIFCCFPLGIFAFVYGLKVMQLWNAGERDRASRLSEKVLLLNLVAICCGLFLMVAIAVTVPLVLLVEGFRSWGEG